MRLFDENCVYSNPRLARGMVRNVIASPKGQAFLKRLRKSLDRMRKKRLQFITDAVVDGSGVNVFGALDPGASPYTAKGLAAHFKVPASLVSEVAYMNDDWAVQHGIRETPEERWTRVRGWIDSQIIVESSGSQV